MDGESLVIEGVAVAIGVERVTLRAPYGDALRGAVGEWVSLS